MLLSYDQAAAAGSVVAGDKCPTSQLLTLASCQIIYFEMLLLVYEALNGLVHNTL